MAIRSSVGPRLCAFAVGTLVLLALGIQAWHDAPPMRVPRELSCADFIRRPPTSGWVRLTGCELQWPRTVYRTRKGSLTDLYVPAASDARRPGAATTLVFAISDQDSLELAEYVLTPKQSNVQVILRLQKLLERFDAKPIDGLARSGIVEETEVRSQLAQTNVKLAPKFAVIDVNKRPTLLHQAPGIIGAVVFHLAAAGCLIGFVVTWRRMPRQISVPTARASATAPPPVVKPVSEEVARLLEDSKPLQLVPATDADRTLGMLRDVKKRIGEVLPGVTFDAAGRGSFTRTNYSVTFETGKIDPALAITIVVTGGTAAAPSLQRLIDKTGWRLIAPEQAVAVAS